MSLSYAYYRLPYESRYTLVSSEREPLRLASLTELGGEAGFAIVPFDTAGPHPTLLIPADKVETRAITPLPAATAATSLPRTTQPSEDYEAAFGCFHEAVSSGKLRKLVLARRKTVAVGDTADGVRLFLRACQMYPRLMIMLHHTPVSGTWIVASPEILVESRGTQGHTVALAGTMPWADGYARWSRKNQQEQHVVEQYIESAIGRACHDIVKDGPVTMRAGALQHLRTDFRFRFHDTVGLIAAALHPTPAVCGWPKAEAQAFIADNEGLDREYYSGCAGPVAIASETHLYVALRCAKLSDGHAQLYAGGGIMPESECRSEWQETEMKMQTILNALNV